jgi:hypothetical protein
MGEYLKLSDQQVLAIQAARAEFEAFAARAQARIAELQEDIANQRAKERLDANVIGADYAAIEMSLRAIRDEWTRTQSRIRQELSMEQRAKLQVLENAAKLQPLIQAAQCSGIID